MFCPKCNSQVSDETNICPKCGNKVNEIEILPVEIKLEYVKSEIQSSATKSTSSNNLTESKTPLQTSITKKEKPDTYLNNNLKSNSKIKKIIEFFEECGTFFSCLIVSIFIFAILVPIINDSKNFLEIFENIFVGIVLGVYISVFIYIGIKIIKFIIILLKFILKNIAKGVTEKYYSKYIVESLKKLENLDMKYMSKPYYRQFVDRVQNIKNHDVLSRFDFQGKIVLPKLSDIIKLKKLREILPELIDDIEIEAFKDDVDNLKNIPNPRPRYSQEFITELDSLVAEALQNNLDITQKNTLSPMLELLKEKCQSENDRIVDENKRIYMDIQNLKEKLHTLTQDKKFSTDFFDYARETEDKLDIDFEGMEKSLSEIYEIIDADTESVNYLESMIEDEEKTADEVSELEVLILKTIEKKTSDEYNDYSHAFENKFTGMQTILNRLKDIHKQSLSGIQTELKKLQENVESIISDMNKELSEMEERLKIKENYHSELENFYSEIEKILLPDVEIVRNADAYAEVPEKITRIIGIQYEDAKTEYNKLKKEICELKSEIQQEIMGILEERRIARIEKIESLSVTAKSILDLLPSFSGNTKIDQSLLKKIVNETESLICSTNEFISRRT